MKLSLVAILLKSFLLGVWIPGWLTYSDLKNKFTMQYPKEWSQANIGSALAFLSPKEGANDHFQENLTLVLQDLSGHPMTLDRYTEFNKKQVTDRLGASAIVSQGARTLGGQKAFELVFNLNYQGHSLKIREWWFLKGSFAYLFTFTSEPGQYGRYEPTASSIVNSFAFLK